MESHHEGQGRRYCGAGYAPAGHPAGQRPGGDIPGGYCIAGAFLRGGERAHQHPPTAGRGYRGGESKGRAVWAATQTAAGGLSQRLSTLESQENHGDSGGTRMRDAAVHLSLPGGDLRKIGYSVSMPDLQECVLSCKSVHQSSLLYYSTIRSLCIYHSG